MDTLLTIVMVLLFIAVMNKLDTKKPPARHIPAPGRTKLPPPLPNPWPTEAKPGPEKKTPERPAFEIPPIQGAPKAERKVYQEPGSVQQELADRLAHEQAERQHDRAYFDAMREEEARQRAAEQAEYQRQAHLTAQAQVHMNSPEIQAAALRQAIVYAEVLGAPKARNNRRWHR